MVFKTKDFADFINTNYFPLKLDGNTDTGRQIRNKWLVPGYPTMVLLTSNGEEIDRIVGFEGNKNNYFQLIKDYTAGKNTLKDLLTKVKNDPENIQLNYNIANKFNDRGDDRNALMYYENVLRYEPDHQSEIYLKSEFNVAESKAYTEDEPQFLLHYAQNCTNKNLKYYAYSSLARFYSRKKDQTNVIKTYEEALVKLPENASLMNSYGWYIFQNEVADQYERGIAVARQAVAIEPESDSIWDTLGQLLFAAGSVNEAIAAMQKAADLAPDEQSYQENLARYQLSKK